MSKIKRQYVEDPDVNELVVEVVVEFGVRPSDAVLAVQRLLSVNAVGATLAQVWEAFEATKDRHSRQSLRSPIGFLTTEARHIVEGMGAPTPEQVKSMPRTDALAAAWKPYETAGPPAGTLKSLGDELAPLREKMAERLKALPEIPNEELEDKPACARCADAGVVRKAVPVEHPDFGVPFPCVCMNESPEHREDRLLAACGLRGPMLRMTLSSIEAVDGIAEGLAAAARFIEGDLQQLVYIGKPGGGKTHLAVGAMLACIQKGEAGIYVNVSRFLDELRNTYNDDAETSFREACLPIMEWPVAVLDDLYAEKASEWTREKVYGLVDWRYAAGLRTIAVSNHSPETWDERVRSRLCDRQRGAIVVVKAKDYRLAVKP